MGLNKCSACLKTNNKQGQCNLTESCVGSLAKVCVIKRLQLFLESVSYIRIDGFKRRQKDLMKSRHKKD